MSTEPIEKLRDRVLGSPYSYAQIAEEAGFGNHGESYLRKFSVGQIGDLTSTRFFVLKAAMDRLDRRGAKR